MSTNKRKRLKGESDCEESSESSGEETTMNMGGEEIEEEIEWEGPDSEEEENEEETMGEEPEEIVKSFRPHKGMELKEDEKLEFSNDAYKMMHRWNSPWPCLSFDCIRDLDGNSREKFPMSCYLVAGSQAETDKKNCVYIMKLGDLNKTQYDSDEEGEDDGFDTDPTIYTRTLNHHGSVNRIRVMTQDLKFVGTQSSTKKIHIWSIKEKLNTLNYFGKGYREIKQEEKPIFTYDSEVEGYGLAWSPLKTGALISGDNNGNILLWLPQKSEWKISQNIYKEHRSSIEDLQWSPMEAPVFASCSSDKSIKIWDIRNFKNSKRSFQASKTDVNVISWSKKVNYFLASGDDDGNLCIWDLRMLKKDLNGFMKPIAFFNYHKEQITSVEWSNWDDSTIACCGADDLTTIWDLSVEKDVIEQNSNSSGGSNDKDVPPQLMFEHLGQQNVKELHWHPQLKNVMLTTSETGFHIFQPCNL